MNDQYVQRLSGLSLTIEKATGRTPDKQRYHVFLDDQIAGSFRRLADAQTLFRKLRDESDWAPPERSEPDAQERLRRENEARHIDAKREYWGQAAKARGYGMGKYRW